jgi:lactose/L-arabinose transport system ATP-binding protein
MARLELRNVRKSFGAVDVILGADLEIDDGEFVVFVGPSGCGKSTLLRLVAGLEDVSSGQVLIGGNDVTTVDASERGVAMVFQSYALYPHMTVAQNMGFGLRMAGRAKAEIADRVAQAARILHLETLLDRRPKQLSGGQRQRVAIGRAIVRQPKVFLFDEPLSNLDAELRVQMRLELAKLHRELGTTMIYVTHDQVEAMTLADKIVVLRAGRIEQVGAPMELYNNPVNMFVAGFIGSPKMNFLQAHVVKSGAGRMVVRLDGDSREYSFAASTARQRASGPVTVGIRPEHFDPDGAVRIQTEIDVIENLGGTSYAYARDGSGTPLTIEVGERQLPKEGKPWTARFDPDRALLFDTATGSRIP